MNKEKIAVLMGGRSLEREVSLKSGERVCQALEDLGYKVLPLDLSPTLVQTLRSERPDACYIALHGRYGEDGAIQELLEFLGVPYTGPGVVSSVLAWDKPLAKRLFAEHSIPTPAWVSLTADAFKQMGAASALDLVVESTGPFPLAVKPAKQGSALGLTRVDSADRLAEALLTALSYDDAAMIEKWVEGRMVAVSVFDGPEGPQPLPPVEISPKSGVFDFASMYTAGETDYFVPARLDEAVMSEVKKCAIAVHTLLECRDVSRVDMIVDSAGGLHVLECNTSPGMTETSLLPMAAQAVGLSLADVVEKLVSSALARSAGKKQ